MSITFYDIPSSLPGCAWSPNTFKTRYTLNFKGIPYKTEWVEYPDIEPLCKKLGIPPSSKDYYTLPAIHDPSTGVYISDSIRIAEYLERTYPDTPQVFPHNTLPLQDAFVVAFAGNLTALWNFIIPAICDKLSPRSEEYFRRTREKSFGKAMEDIVPKGEVAVAEWAKFKEGMGKIDAWYAKNRGKGPFLLGETPSWGDIVIASYFLWMRIVWGEDSQQWKDVSTWNNGRWAGIVEALKKYETVV
ncbi:hypothetical protein M413DRAFT_445896 [Hebeloma cylindrosporum]|uniref:GST N-terminal domain-containing protein n=1 Tax=Hebeloma cylindrosporum TaxID=76867 RepID=A0A0C2XU81_HEBCY|nr:hypothetical protein M413DRAFT_445896 [Hebeloma cylindrosporum h7]